MKDQGIEKMGRRRRAKRKQREQLEQMLLAMLRKGELERALRRLHETVAEEHPVTAAYVRSGFLERLADHMVGAEPHLAARLYDLAVQDLQIWASGASGQGDGRSRMAEVEAVRDKRRQLS